MARYMSNLKSAKVNSDCEILKILCLTNMAQGNSQDLFSNHDDDNKNCLECPVCLQTCMHPARLPCGHTFCYLCVKGVANQSKRCALCRAEIPIDFLDHPYLLEKSDIEVAHDGYQWFYEGRNGGWWKYDERTAHELEVHYKAKKFQIDMLICGILYVIDFTEHVQYRKNENWRKRRIKRDLKTNMLKGWWQYDERTSTELESSFSKNEKTCELLIAGFLYLIDFEAMMQIRRNDPRRKRLIKRDISTIPKKGVAGIRSEGSSNVDNTGYAEEVQNLSQETHTRNRLDLYPDVVETNIAYQNLDHSNISEGAPDESDYSDNEHVDNIESHTISSFEQTDLNNGSLESHEFDHFILNRIRTMNIADGGNESESD